MMLSVLLSCFKIPSSDYLGDLFGGWLTYGMADLLRGFLVTLETDFAV
jgi:hypothetical protein